MTPVKVIFWVGIWIVALFAAVLVWVVLCEFFRGRFR